jgi:GT2 family glycosyltransferase
MPVNVAKLEASEQIKMPAKVLHLEVSEQIKPVWAMERYDTLHILVRYHGRPIGWVNISNKPRHAMISSDQVREAIAAQASWQLALGCLHESLKTSTKRRAESPAISVVVCTRDRADELAGCLSTLMALKYSVYEVIVVDNAPSNNKTANLVASLPVRYVCENRPGLDWARNRGIAEARYEIIAFTDDDVRVDRAWLQAIGSAFSEPEVMAVTGLITPAELETDAQHLFELKYGGMGKGLHRRVFRQRELTIREMLWANRFGVGANMAFRREVFESIGNFDVALDVGTPSGGGGDLDMFHRLVAKGHTLVYEPSAVVCHIHRRSAALLHRQIYDNGRSFGGYLLTCARNRTINRLSIVRFAAWNWLATWILRRLVRPRGFPRRLIFAELMGAIGSPMAYRAAQVHARRIVKTQPNSGG